MYELNKICSKFDDIFTKKIEIDLNLVEVRNKGLVC